MSEITVTHPAPLSSITRKNSTAFAKLCVIFGTEVLLNIGPFNKGSKDYQTRRSTLLGNISSKSTHEGTASDQKNHSWSLESTFRTYGYEVSGEFSFCAIKHATA